MTERTVRVQRGLSIAELFIILALVFVLAAAVIPRVLHSQITAGEDSARVNLAIVNQAQGAYARRFPSVGFAARLSDLGAPRNGCNSEPTPVQACLLYFALAHADQRSLNGYKLNVFSDEAALPRRKYLLVAVPEQYGRTGHRTFCSTEDHVLRERDLGPAPALQSINRDACQGFARVP